MTDGQIVSRAEKAIDFIYFIFHFYGLYISQIVFLYFCPIL